MRVAPTRPYRFMRLLGALATLVVAAFGLCAVPINDGPGSQATYAEELGQARQQLFKGQFVHTDARSWRLVAGAAPRVFRVRVLGSWHRVKPGETQAPVSAGAQIGVRLHCVGAGLQCMPLSSERQNVLSRSDKATWVWIVSAQHAGTVSIALTVTAYLGDTDTVLIEKPPETLRVQVAPPPSAGRWTSWAEDLWRWVTTAITSLGGIAVSVSAIAAVVLMVIRRRLPAGDDAGTTEQVRRVARRPRTRPVRARHTRPGLPRTQLTAARSPRPGPRTDAGHEPRE